MLRKKYKSFQWDENEKQIVMSLFHEKKPFEEISIAVNDYLNTMRAQYDFVPIRTPVAVACRCLKLNLITAERLENYIKEYENKLRKDRTQGIYSDRKKVFERDGNKCVVCSSDQKLRYCHLIPFRDTRKNEELNTVTLCEAHHKEFDHHKKAVVRIVYKRMCSYYPEFPTKFVLAITECSIHGKHLQIKKKC